MKSKKEGKRRATRRNLGFDVRQSILFYSMLSRILSQTGLAAPEPPNEFMCPISLNLLNDPVIASDGHTYERKEIEKWFASHRKSPKTGNNLGDLRLIENIALRQLIDDFRTKHGLPGDYNVILPFLPI